MYVCKGKTRDKILTWLWNCNYMDFSIRSCHSWTLIFLALVSASFVASAFLIVWIFLYLHYFRTFLNISAFADLGHQILLAGIQESYNASIQEGRWRGRQTKLLFKGEFFNDKNLFFRELVKMVAERCLNFLGNNRTLTVWKGSIKIGFIRWWKLVESI